MTYGELRPPLPLSTALSTPAQAQPRSATRSCVQLAAGNWRESAPLPIDPVLAGACRAGATTTPAISARLAYCRNIQDQPIDIPDNFLVRLFPVKLLFRFGMSDPARFAYIGD